MGFNPLIACEGPYFTAQQHSIKSYRRFTGFFFPNKAVVSEKVCEIVFCFTLVIRLFRSVTHNTIPLTPRSICNLLSECQHQLTSSGISLQALMEVLISSLSPCFHVFCALLSRQMAQVQFTPDSQPSLMFLETDCLQVAIKGVELPLLLDFYSGSKTSMSLMVPHMPLCFFLFHLMWSAVCILKNKQGGEAHTQYTH